MAKGLAFGRNHGHRVTQISKKNKRVKPSSRKGKLGHRTKFVRQIIRELCGIT